MKAEARVVIASASWSDFEVDSELIMEGCRAGGMDSTVLRNLAGRRRLRRGRILLDGGRDAWAPSEAAGGLGSMMGGTRAAESGTLATMVPGLGMDGGKLTSR